jgi:alpha-glucosidase
MQDKAWKQGIHSSVSAPYVKPLFPSKGETVRVEMQVPLSDEILEVRLVSFQLGREKQYLMQAYKQRYAAEVTLRDDTMYWYFLIVAQDRAYSYSLLALRPLFLHCVSVSLSKQELSLFHGWPALPVTRFFPTGFAKAILLVEPKKANIALMAVQ